MVLFSRHRSWIFLLLTISAPLTAASVIKANRQYILVSTDASGRWKLNEKACVVRNGHSVACGKVFKISDKGNAIIRVATRTDPSLTIVAGDLVSRSGRNLASEGQIQSSVDRFDPVTSNFQVSLELLGVAGLYDLFASYRFSKHWAANLGFSYFSVSTTALAGTATASISVLQFPFSISALLGDGPNSSFEILGGGDLALASGTATVISSSGLSGSTSQGGLLLDLGLGYRYWPAQGGFHFRATLYGIYSLAASSFFPYGGVSLGYAF